MRAAIIDDRSYDRTTLYHELDSVLRERGYIVEAIDLFSGGEEFLADFRRGKYDLIFLDIYMEGINGIQTAAEIRRQDKSVRLIFATTSNDFAAESYSLRADYYLLKPYVHEDIVKAMKLIDLASYEKQRIIRLPDHTTCLLHDIIFSEYFNHKIGLHLKGHKVMKVRASQAGMESLLCSNDFFVPCTKGIIVNLEYVKKIDDNTIFLEDDNQVPVSRRRMADIKKAHAAYLFQRVRQ